MGVFYHEEQPNHPKRCKFLPAALREVLSHCRTFADRLSTASLDEDFPMSDFDEEQEVNLPHYFTFIIYFFQNFLPCYNMFESREKFHLKDFWVVLVIFLCFLFRWLFRKSEAEPWKDRSASLAYFETVFPGFTLRQQKNYISLKWNQNKGREAMKKTKKEKNFCLLVVVSRTVRVQ